MMNFNVLGSLQSVTASSTGCDDSYKCLTCHIDLVRSGVFDETYTSVSKSQYGCVAGLSLN